MVCTLVGYSYKKVTPTLVRSEMPVDGPVVLQLNNELKLKVVHNMLGESTYTIIAIINDIEVEVPMKSVHKIRFTY